MKASISYRFAAKVSLLLLGLCYLIPTNGQVANGKDYLGDWSGALSVEGSELALAFHIEEKEGKLAATIDVPAQGVKGFNASEVLVEGEKITIKFAAFQALYEGELFEGGEKIIGTWSQGGGNFELEMNKTALAETVSRPQEPKAPFSYLVEEVVYPNPAAEIELAGTLTLPKTPGPHAVAILISGSGPQDRNEELMGHKPFLVLADYLTNNGIAVLRYDDRGVGKSTGDFQAATSLDFSTDVTAAINYLNTREDIDAKKIGLIGHSEGGLIAPIIASQSPELAFIVLLAGPGIKCDELLIMQGELIGKSMGRSEEEVQKEAALNREIYDIIKSTSPELTKEKLVSLLQSKFDALSDEEKQQQNISADEMATSLLQQVGTPWFRYFLNFDPEPYLTKVKCPTLAINGAKDLQVPSTANLQAIKKALEKAPCKDFMTKEFAELNHLFQTADTGAISEYYTIEETFSPKALAYLKDWISDRVK